MKFDVMTECISCNERKLCNEIPTEYEGKQMVINFCKECHEEIEEIQEWAEKYSLRNIKFGSED